MSEKELVDGEEIKCTMKVHGTQMSRVKLTWHDTRTCMKCVEAQSSVFPYHVNQYI
jgi:hypothetical protein